MSNQAYRLAIAVLLALPFLTAACGKESGSESDDTGSEGTVEDIGAICSYDDDCLEHCVEGLPNQPMFCSRSCEKDACPPGYACVSRGQAGMVCAMHTCKSEADCPIDYLCDPDTDERTGERVCLHRPMTCKSDPDCPGASACNQGLCELRCEGDEDCKQDFYCHWGHACFECTMNPHCKNNFSCEGGKCNEACVDNEDCRLGFECVATKCRVIRGGGPGKFRDACNADEDCAEFCQGGYYCGKACKGAGDDKACPPNARCHAEQMVCEPIPEY